MAEENKCFKCNATSKERVLIKAEVKGKNAFVCTACMPAIIHGSQTHGGQECE